MSPLLSALLAGTLLLGQVPTAASVELKDQYGAVDRVTSLRGDIAVVMVVTARRLRTVKPWERALREHHEAVRTVLIADVPDDPPAEYHRVAAKLRKRVPEGVRVLIDIDRVWARELELDTSGPNLLVLDSDGSVVASFHGRWDADADDELLATLDRLREAA
jgi:hypothetical protein